MGPIGCTETSVTYYHPTLRNIPEERRPHIQCRVSLKSRMPKSETSQCIFKSGHSVSVSIFYSVHSRYNLIIQLHVNVICILLHVVKIDWKYSVGVNFVTLQHISYAANKNECPFISKSFSVTVFSQKKKKNNFT